MKNTITVFLIIDLENNQVLRSVDLHYTLIEGIPGQGLCQIWQQSEYIKKGKKCLLK